LLIAYGTRPEKIKLDPLMKEFKKRGIPFNTFFTGQHETLVDNKAAEINFIEEAHLNRLDSIVMTILGHDNIFNDITRVLVQGDTTSAFAVALAAYHRQIPVIHLEAGMRTFCVSDPYPEEFNRVAIDQMSSEFFCATLQDKVNLYRGGYFNNIHVVGNTGLDNLLGLETEYGNDVFCTMHRRENHEDMNKWFSAISYLAETNRDFHFILPLHPNPAVTACRDSLSSAVDVVDPMPHSEALEVLRKCRFVITDSGGVQEEASFLKKRAFICRKHTERNECIGRSSLLCSSNTNLILEFMRNSDDYQVDAECPYGDGKSSARIAHIIEQGLPNG